MIGREIKLTLYRIGTYITLASLVWLRAAERTQTPQLQKDVAFVLAGHAVLGMFVVLVLLLREGGDE